MYPFVKIYGFSVSSFVLCVIIAFLVGALVMRHNLTKIEKPYILYIPISIILFGTAFLGAHLFSFFERVNIFTGSFEDISYYFIHSGLNFLGGLLLSVICIWFIFPKIFKIDKIKLTSSLMPVLAVVYSIGRVGCLLSGDGCYGKPTNLCFGMSFPNGVIPTLENVYPTPLFESVVSFIFFILIQKRFNNSKTPNSHLCNVIITFFVFGLVRFFVEFLRTNPKYFYLTQAQWISLCLVLLALLLYKI